MTICKLTSSYLYRMHIIKKIIICLLLLVFINLLAIFISPFYAANLIRTSLFFGEISLYSAYWHDDRLYYALCDVTGNFFEYSDRNCYIARLCSRDDDNISLDLIRLYSNVSEERNKLSILGMLASIGEMEFVHSQDSFLVNVLRDSIVPSTITHSESESRWNNLSLEEKEHTPRDDDMRKITNARSGMWALKYIANPAHLDIIKDVMWYYHSDSSTILNAVAAIEKIGDLRGADILCKFADEFSNDEETKQHFEKAIEKITCATKSL